MPELAPSVFGKFGLGNAHGKSSLGWGQAPAGHHVEDRANELSLDFMRFGIGETQVGKNIAAAGFNVVFVSVAHVFHS